MSQQRLERVADDRELMAELRQNAAKRRLAAGGVVVSTLPIVDLDLLEQVLAATRIDVVWADMEHEPWGWREIRQLSRVCDLWGAIAMVRVLENEPKLIGKALDMGAQAVIVPHVTSRAEAERAVRSAYYTPKGLRAIGGPRQALGVTDYYRHANAEVMLGIMVEDVEGVERFDEIASVDGIDFIHVGAADLAQSMGPDHLGRPAHPDVRATVHDLVRRGVELGVAMGAAVNVDNVGAALDRGARFLVVNPAAEVGAALAGFRAHLDELVGEAG